MPIRIQRKRTKGWRMPENTVYVGRPGPFGNPLPRNFQSALYRAWLCSGSEQANRVLDAAPILRGKNLACWCALDARCHADVLLELANTPAVTSKHG